MMYSFVSPSALHCSTMLLDDASRSSHGVHGIYFRWWAIFVDNEHVRSLPSSVLFLLSLLVERQQAHPRCLTTSQPLPTLSAIATPEKFCRSELIIVPLPPSLFLFPESRCLRDHRPSNEVA